VAAHAARLEAEARATAAEAMVAHLKLMIEKFNRNKFGQSSERARQLDQLELQLEELEAAASEDALAAEAAAARAAPEAALVKSFERRKPVRAPVPAHLPHERVVIPAPCSCRECGGKLAKLGEDVTKPRGALADQDSLCGRRS
jgi:transposase